MLKNLIKGFLKLRNRHKTFTFVIVICFSVLSFFISLLNQMQKNVESFWVDSIIGGNIVTISNNDFFDFYTPLDLNKSFSYNSFLDLQKDENNFSPRIRTVALVENQQSLPMIITGIDFEKEKLIGNHIIIEEGKGLEKGKNEILLTYATALTIGVELGDDVYITVISKDGYPSYEVMKLTGYIDFGNIGTIFGDNIAYVPIESFREICASDIDDVTEIVTSQKQINNNQGAYSFINGQNMFSTSKLIVSAIVILKILLIFCFGIFLLVNIITNIQTIINEKNTEISVYLTFGASPIFIRIKIFGELLLYTFYTCFIGCFISYFLIKGFNSLGFYSIDYATEMLMSSSRFVITNVTKSFLLVLIIIFILMFAGAMKTVLKNTSSLTINKIEETK